MMKPSKTFTVRQQPCILDSISIEKCFLYSQGCNSGGRSCQVKTSKSSSFKEACRKKKKKRISMEEEGRGGGAGGRKDGLGKGGEEEEEEEDEEEKKMKQKISNEDKIQKQIGRKKSNTHFQISTVHVQQLNTEREYTGKLPFSPQVVLEPRQRERKRVSESES